jgi:hypothetical protein
VRLAGSVALDFVRLALDFVRLALDFVRLALDFVRLALDFVRLDFGIGSIGIRGRRRDLPADRAAGRAAPRPDCDEDGHADLAR